MWKFIKTLTAECVFRQVIHIFPLPKRGSSSKGVKFSDLASTLIDILVGGLVPKRPTKIIDIHHILPIPLFVKIF
jgi:hypothetical protein